MLVTELGIITLVRLLQFLNALSTMLVTELGIVTLVRLLHPLNAQLPMLVTALPTFTSNGRVDHCGSPPTDGISPTAINA